MDASKKPSSSLGKCLKVSDEEFNNFHSIDRELFTRLVHNLGLDPALSMQMVAFFMWLEKQSKDMYLILRMLSLPLFLLNELADEAAICLKCAECDLYPFGDSNDVVISLLPDIIGNRVVTTRFFYENRVAVLRGVTKIVDSVCTRAFRDILQRTWQADVGRVPPVQFAGSKNEVGQSSRVAERNDIGGRPMPPLPPVQFAGSKYEVGQSSRVAERNDIGGRPMPPLPQPQGLLYNPFVQLPPLSGQAPMIQVRPPPQMNALPHPQIPVVEPAIGIPANMLTARGFPVYDLEVQRQMLGNELLQMLEQNLVIGNGEEIRNVNYGEQVEEEQVAVEEVPADDRTVFLTFSKGYPISENEVRQFFTKRFGDFIEELILQEVSEGEQVLYARMVVRPRLTAVINVIVGGNRAKYSINGKHVWARKYVKKQQASTSRTSPPRATGGSSSSSQPSAAPAPEE